MRIKDASNIKLFSEINNGEVFRFLENYGGTYIKIESVMTEDTRYARNAVRLDDGGLVYGSNYDKVEILNAELSVRK